MDLKAGLLFLAIVVPASIGFQWTSSSQIPDGSSFRACVSERASFPWSFSLSTGEHVISVEWYRTTDKGEVLLAGLLAGHFLPTAGQNVTFVPSAGLQVGHLNLAEFGTYSVRVNCSNNGSLLSNRQTAFLSMEDAPVLAESHLVASVWPEPVLDDVTGRPHVQLLCGHFLSLGSRPVSVVWKTPSDHTVASTIYINGTFRLNLPHPTQGGRYYCHLKDPSVAARCIPNVSRLMRGAYIHLDEVQIRLSLLEGGLQGLQARDEKLDGEMDRQAGLDSELQLREQNLTAEVGRLAEITKLLLTRTEKLTSDSDRLTSDNEKLKTQTNKLTTDNEKLNSQTEKLTSDNVKLKSQTEKLTSDNEKLKSQTEKLTSENGKLKSQTDKLASENERLKTQTDKLKSDNEKQKTQIEKQMQTMTSQFTDETAKLSRRVDNVFTNTKDLSTQLLTLKSRSVAFSSLFSTDDIANGLVFSVGSTLKFDKVLLNLGDGYNPHNGIFTAPAAGLYVFTLTAMTSDNGGSAGLELVTEGNTLALTWGRGRGTPNDQSTKTVPVQLDAGDQVWVAQHNGAGLRGSWWTTFSGFLVQADQ